MIDIFYATISGEEHERLDKLDAERRAHTERLTPDAGQRPPESPDEKWWRQMNNIHSRAAYASVAGPEYEYQDNPGSGATPRPWRPEQHAADTVLSHFDTSGKELKDA